MFAWYLYLVYIVPSAEGAKFLQYDTIFNRIL